MSLEVLRTVEDVRAWRAQLRAQGRTVGFVPTMGAIHDGHVSLARAAAAATEVVIVSIFVNPTQFAPTDDFDSYPKTFDEDVSKLSAAGAAAVFAPTSAVMYAGDFSMFVTPAGADDLKGEGTCRPGFFRGVCTVVTKLFNIVQPDRAFFGQKDGLQSIMVQKLVRDLDMPLTVTICPTVREADGLAMSSRNVYLSAAQRAAAPAIYQALLKGRAAWRAAIDSAAAADAVASPSAGAVAAVKAAVEAALEAAAGESEWIDPQYVYVSDCRTGEELSESASKTAAGTATAAATPKKVMVAVAVKCGPARLIDNIVLAVNADEDML